MVLVAVLLPIQPALMFTPGAKRSTQVPILAQVGRASELVLAVTVMAEGSLAGDVVQASTAMP